MTVYQRFDIKTTRIVLSGLTLKPMMTAFFGLATKPVVTISHGLASKLVAWVFCFGPQNR
jgi:hypothetical protein